MAKTKLTNAEILQQVANMSEFEANDYGVTDQMRTMAARAAGGDRAATASFYAQYTPLYNAFCGFIVKFAMTALSKAYYTDVYAKHHRNMLQGRPELGFVKPAKAGTGNSDAEFAALPAQGSLTTVVTADMPDVVALYDISVHKYVARIPVSYEDVKTAFTNEYGINDLYTKVREGLEDKIVEDRNKTYDTALTTAATTAIKAGTGSEIAANKALATYVTVPGTTDWATVIASGSYADVPEADLVQVFIAIKNVFYGIIGRPISDYNALGELNNAPKENIVGYIDARLWSEMSRVKASLFNYRELEQDGLTLLPLRAPWLGKVLGDDSRPVLAAVGTSDFIRDYPTSDFASSVPTDRGSIESRFMTTQLATAGYEPFVFIYGAAGSPEPPTPALSTFNLIDIGDPNSFGGTAVEILGVKADGQIERLDSAAEPPQLPIELANVIITVADPTSLSVGGVVVLISDGTASATLTLQSAFDTLTADAILTSIADHPVTITLSEAEV